MVAGMAAVHNGPNGTPANSGYFRHADWLGSSRLAHDGGGNVVYDRAYAPFGEPYAETATTNRDFTGQTEDTTPGLYDFLFRQQSQSQGRWLVPDPAGLAAVDPTNPQTWNRYAYVGNNPLSRTDRLGLLTSNQPPPQPPPPFDPLSWWDVWGNWYYGPLNPFRFEYLIEPGGIGGGGDDAVDPSKQPPDDPNRPPLRNHNGCGAALNVAGQAMAAVQNAFANWSTLDSAANGNWDGAALLAAVGVRESGFQNVNENDGAGVGVGVFQITVSPTSAVTAAQAGNLTWAANYAENMLTTNGKYLGNKFPNFTSAQLLQATAASYNFGTNNISGNPKTIDVGSTGDNYGSNVVQIMENCF